MTTNQLRYWELQENIRANKARETETNRTNIVNEGISRSNMGVNAFKNVVAGITGLLGSVFGKAGILGTVKGGKK